MISKQQGFGLLDSLIALAVLSVGVLGLVKLQTYVDKKADYALNSIEALHLAEEKLELFRTRSANSSAIGTMWFDGVSLAAATYSDTISVSASSYTFNREWVIEDKLPLSGSAGAKLITVTVDWTDRWGETPEIELKTMISRYSEFD